MNIKYSSMLAACFITATTHVSYAASLRCHGNIISPGITEQQLLEACGNPTSRKGPEWIYDMPGSIPIMVTLGNDVVMFISDVDEAGASSTSPLGDPP